LRRPQAATLDPTTFAALPAPPLPGIQSTTWNVLVAGIGGTGVVTVGSVLAMAAHLEGKRAAVIDMTGLAQKNGAVWSHLRIGDAASTVVGARVGLAEADLLLGCDLVTAAEKDSVFTLDATRTRAIINSWLQPTAQFQLDPNARLDLESELRPIRAGVGASRLHAVDATSLALRLLGNTLGANFLLVGYALQAGGLPLSLAAIERALEMNGQAVDFNKRALALGRLAAHDPEAIEKLLDAASPSGVPRIPPAQTLDAIVRRRTEYLVEYQDRRYADRYVQLVDTVRDAERTRSPGMSGLAEAVARNYFKLLAYKDEYEVARLHSSPAFLGQIAATFEGDYELRFHLAPPLLSRLDPRTGRVHKREFGPWVLGLFRVLAKFKGLRGTALDPFAHLADRKLERRLIGDYETLVGELVERLDAGKHALAVELASLPEQVRGYGHVKLQQLEAAQRRQEQLLQTLRSVKETAAAA
jgi:indolepyruvate ferredoxin oxidoreductase